MRTDKILPAVIVCAALLAGAAIAQDYVAKQRRAAAMLDALDARHYGDARIDFDDAVRETLPAERLREFREALPKQLGTASERGPVHPETINDLSAAVTPLRYRMATLDALITFDATGRINGCRLDCGTLRIS